MTGPASERPASGSGMIGVLLVNLGTPDAPTPAAVRRYLAEFLSDPRVVEIPAAIWQPILRGAVLTTRPRKSAHAYAQIWTARGSPLAAITAEQAEKLQARLGEGVRVAYATRYGRPAIAAQLAALLEAGCERILLAPLYPQYSASTTATAFDKAAEALGAMRRQPALRFLPPYYADEAYIGALARDLGAQLDALAFAPEALVLSFHGVPERTVRLGDPYYRHCLETARLLEAALARPDLRCVTAFQSRFGRAKWLEPATTTVLEEEAARGTRRLAIAAPGFSVDCLETLEELAIRGREQFLAAGGEHFAALACLNAGEAGMDMLEALVRRELQGWLERLP
jgi:ferrochelatase